MIISIQRVYLSGLEAEVLVNTRYIREIVQNYNEKKPRTKLVMDSLTNSGPHFIYTNHTLAVIRGKITKASKGQVE